LGTIPIGHFLAYKASHKLHIQLAKAIDNGWLTMDNWQWTIDNIKNEFYRRK
jgi:UDP-3-O-acyl-N-acetylglucosamine deacetylase